MKLLALDTATENCSAALLIGTQVLEREFESPRGHAEHLLPMIEALLSEAGVRLGALDAIVFGRGPGSFTGVRLAASITQGLAFAANRPVVAISDLAAVAQQAFTLAPQCTGVLVCNDARMGEVYWAPYLRRAGLPEPAAAEQVSPPAAVRTPSGTALAGVGRGFAAHAALAAQAGVVVPAGWERLLPRAADLLHLAVPEVEAGRVLAPCEALPIYVRDSVAKPSLT
jgi:tRNA threonylcarbamoyladenosine biosynthesis protein TsaB